MRTSKKDLLKTAKLLGAICLSKYPESLDELQSCITVGYSVGKYGLTAKLIFDTDNKNFYFIGERNGILFSLS